MESCKISAVASEHFMRIALRAPNEEKLRRLSERVEQIRGKYLKYLIRRDTHWKMAVADDEPKFPHKGVSSSWYFPLERCQGAVVQKGQRFDLRGTLDEFVRKVYEWEDLEEGMEIQVSLVGRDQIPSYLFKEANHNEVQQATNRRAVGSKVGDIGH